jgi:hypothetical protein
MATDSTKRDTFTVTETEDTITKGARLWDDQFRNRLNYDRLTVLTQAINAWHTNPIARRIVELTTEFVIGDGFSFNARNDRVSREIKNFWEHPLNDLDQQVPEWADEAWRTGDLFILFSVDQGGMPYVRAIPSEMINEIQTADNDYRQETAYLRNPLDEHPYPAYDSKQEQESFILHFPLNRPVGSPFGESDLAPILYWISLYRQWLEDRARAAHNAALFSYVVTKPFASPEEKISYANDFNARMPKKPGSVIVLNSDEIVGTITAGLQSFEATQDGLALKKMIATGAGIPTHYLAEPESSTRTTAEAAGTPAFKRFKSRQMYLKHVVQTVVSVALAIRRRTTSRLPAAPDFDIIVPDISERDNATLAIGAQRIVNAFAPLYNARLIDSAELIRLVYRFVAETSPEDIPIGFTPINMRGTSRAPGDKPQPDETPPDS